MLKQLVRHQIAIAGQVKDALTDNAIAGATIKIIAAPDAFIERVIFKTKLLGLPITSTQWRSLNSILKISDRDLPRSLQEFLEILANPQPKNNNLVNCFQQVLNDSSVLNQDKFQALQTILDYFSLPISSPQKRVNQFFGRVQTSADGWFYFTDLPPGFYRLEACLPAAGLRYSQANAEIEIDREDRLNNSNSNTSFHDKLRLKFELKPTTLLGKVTDSEDGEAIGMAKIQLQDSGESTLSFGEMSQHQSDKWNYRLVGIEPSNSLTTVTVSAKGYSTQRQPIHLQTGEVKSLDFQLVSQRSSIS